MEQKNKMSEELPIIALVIGSTLKDNAEIAIQTAETTDIRAMCRPEDSASATIPTSIRPCPAW